MNAALALRLLVERLDSRNKCTHPNARCETIDGISYLNCDDCGEHWFVNAAQAEALQKL